MQLRSDLTSDLKSMAQMSFDPTFSLDGLSSVGPLFKLSKNFLTRCLMEVLNLLLTMNCWAPIDGSS